MFHHKHYLALFYLKLKILFANAYFSILPTGLAIQGLTFIASNNIVAENDMVYIYISWTNGTDVEYALDYGDGSNLTWIWSEQGHLLSYQDLNTTVNHTYSKYENLTMSVTATNTLGSQTLLIDIVIEPILANWVNTSVTHTPKAVPSTVDFIVQLLTSGSYPPILVWCNFSFDDPLNTLYSDGIIFGIVTHLPFHVLHMYQTDQPESLLEGVCQNHVTNITFSNIIILREDVTGLIVESMEYGWPTNQTAIFNITVITGSHLKYNVSFGDVSEAHFVDSVHLSYMESYKVNHTYSLADNYTVTVTAYNKYYNQTNTTMAIIQNRVEQLTFSGTSSVVLPPGDVQFTVNVLVGVVPPSSVFCDWYINNILRDTLFAVGLSLGQSQMYSFHFDRDAIGESTLVHVTCRNLVNQQTLSHTMVVYEVIEGLELHALPIAATPNEIWTLLISMSNGSDVMYNISYGDGLSEEYHNNPIVLAFTSPYTASKSYSETGNYTIRVTAHNDVSVRSSVLHSEFVVQHAIQDLVLWANRSVIWPPGIILFTITAGPNQKKLDNIHCEWNFNDKSLEFSYFDTVEAGDVIPFKWAINRDYLGYLNTSVNCSNMVSSYVISSQISVNLDAVLLGSLESNGSVLWTNTSDFTLNVTRYGTGACFQWDMGDGNAGFLYGAAGCSSQSNGRTFRLIAPDTMIIMHGYVYSTFNVFEVTVFAFNYVSNDTISTKAVVLDWPCSKPKVTFIDNVTYPDAPLVKMKSETFSIKTEYEIDCMKTHIVHCKWEVFEKGRLDQFPVLVKDDQLDFQYNTRELIYGEYVIKLAASMLNATNTTKVKYVYLKIIKTPLHVEIVGDSWIDMMFNTAHSVNGLDLTYDPDVDPIVNQEGLTYTWYCYKNRTDSVFKDVFRGSDAYIADVEASEGCFSSKGGKLVQTTSVFLIDTSLMYPMVFYSMTLEVHKDTRVNTFLQTIYIAATEPPVLSLV